MPLLTANIIVCETILVEKTDVISAIRVMNTLSLAPGNNFAHVFVVTFLASQPRDLSQHILKVRVTQLNGLTIAEAPDYPFVYGYRFDVSGLGGFTLTTEFNIDTSGLGIPSNCAVSADLDGQPVARTTLTLRRA